MPQWQIDLPAVPATDAAVDDDAAWAVLREAWTLPQGLTYLNHGSFGRPPRCVVEAQHRVQLATAENPMAMFLDQFEPRHLAARDRMADFVGADRRNLVLLENATYAMNVVAASFPLAPGDEVLLTDHEYGAVRFTWERACRRAGARVTTGKLPLPVESPEQIVDAVMAAASDQTRLIVVSHVTSGAALKLPVSDICRRAGELGIRTCVDGPHALAVVPLKLDELGCDFYAASCHKWLCGPIGTGFLYARPEAQHLIEPLVQSWGRVEKEPTTWQDGFVWIGTRNPAESLALPVAIDFLEAVGLDRFRSRTHYLAVLARQRLLELPGFSAITPDSETWYGPMVAVRVAYGEATALRDRLRKKHRIEMAVTQRDEYSLVRVACHLYTQPADIERLAAALEDELK